MKVKYENLRDTEDAYYKGVSTNDCRIDEEEEVRRCNLAIKWLKGQINMMTEKTISLHVLFVYTLLRFSDGFHYDFFSRFDRDMMCPQSNPYLYFFNQRIKMNIRHIVMRMKKCIPLAQLTNKPVVLVSTG